VAKRIRWLRPAVVLGGLLAMGAIAAPSVAGAATDRPASSGCNAPAAAGTSTLPLEVGGNARTVVVHVPTGYTGASEVPVVVSLHGSGSTAAAQEAFTGMDATADAKGFLVVYPQALIPSGSGFDWNIPGQPLLGGLPVPPGAADDVAFVEQVVPAVAQRFCIDPSRVGVTGFSGGARLASQLACDAPGTFEAVAPVSGLRYPSPCRSRRAVPVLAMHGTADPVDPFDGNGQEYWTYSVPVAAQRWAAHNGCARTPTTAHPAPTVTRTTFTACRSGATVQLYSIAGVGHEWPGGPKVPVGLARVLGPQSNAVDADNTIWSFFVAHGL
jgi:polyhydroxybutyrate depolymerase